MTPYSKEALEAALMAAMQALAIHNVPQQIRQLLWFGDQQRVPPGVLNVLIDAALSAAHAKAVERGEAPVVIPPGYSYQLVKLPEAEHGSTIIKRVT